MDSEIKPIVIFGAVIIGFTLFSTFFFFSPMSPAFFFSFYEEKPQSALHFLIAVHLFYLFTGVGVVLRTKWGYFLFKVFLYLMLLAFPIGTIISYLALSYMKKHKIKTHFGFAVS